MIDTAAIMDITNKTEAALGGASAPETDRLKDILARAERLEGISLDEAAALLCLEDPEGLSLLFGAAGRVKEAVFGPRIVLFAPLYLSNYCSNDCLYCGFRHSNEEARRKALSPDEAVGQARILSRTGFKRILLVAGEHDRLSGV
ncbi:MAG: radical SAM protein, partial [Nitrospirota bacterium]